MTRFVRKTGKLFYGPSHNANNLELLELQDAPEWGVRLLGTCVLIKKKSSLLAVEFERIVMDSHPSILKPLLKFGLMDEFPWSSVSLDQKQSQIQQAIKNHLHNQDAAIRKDLVTFLGHPRYHIFASELIDLLDDPDPTVTVAVIDSLRKMQAAGIQSPDRP